MLLLPREPRAAQCLRRPAPPVRHQHGLALHFRESAPTRFLLAYRWRLLCLALALAPTLVSGQQTRGESAIGLRVSPRYEGSGVSNHLLRNLDLSYRYALGDKWGLEATGGYWHSAPIASGAPATGAGSRSTRLQAALTLQRVWQMRKPSWRFYAGLGAGLLHYRSVPDNATGSAARERRVRNLTVQGDIGFRYVFKRAPLELDLGLRPSYDGRGFGVDIEPTIGLRYRFGGRVSAPR